MHIAAFHNPLALTVDYFRCVEGKDLDTSVIIIIRNTGTQYIIYVNRCLNVMLLTTGDSIQT